MSKATWIETDHTAGWFILMAGRKHLADVTRCRPRKTKRGYSYSYMSVSKFGACGGMPGRFGQVFRTKREAFAHAETKVGA